MAGFGTTDRYGQAYYGVEGVDLPVSSLVLSSALYEILAGNDPAAMECYVDVTVGAVALPYVEAVTIERGLGDRLGQARITVLCDADDVPSGIVENAEVLISAGVRFGSGEAAAQIFAGRVDNWTAPDKGKIRGTLTAYDDAKRLEDASVSGQAGGDLAAWIEGKAAPLSMVGGFQVINQGAPVVIPASYSVTGFRSVLEAATKMVSAYDQRYVFFSGQGDMVLFDPEYAEGSSSQFSMDRVISFRAKTNTDKRYNRIPYSNYVGYAHDFVTYSLTLNPEGQNNITASTVSSVPIISGTYNDTADQAIYGILNLSGGVQNNICASNAELLAFAESVGKESKRQRYQLSTRFNPFLEIGSRNTVQSLPGFIGRLRHEIRAGSLWRTDMEFWTI
jgi:hypothetical protein